MSPETMILADGTEITTIHYLVQPKFKAPYIACTPGLEDFTAGKYRSSPWIRSDETKAVTCPMCKKTAEFMEAAATAKRIRR